MSLWPSTKARQVLAALLRIGWVVKRQSGSHRTLSRHDWPDVVFAFHDGEEIGPRMMARIAKRTGLVPVKCKQAAFDELPADYREAVTLHRICGLNHAEIAAKMERSEGAVRNLVYRGLSRLALRVEELEGGTREV